MAIFKQAWFIGLIGLVALCLLVWLLGPYLSLGSWAPFETLTGRAIATIVLLLIWAGVVALVYWRRRKANSRLLTGIASDGEGNEGQGEDDVDKLRQQFEDAVKTLKDTHGKRGAISLYDLPWYVIIGPPGAGKTTVLSNSGLRFPLASRFGNKAVRGIGGTRNCDWWFTDEAIFLDTAGRYTTQDSNESVDREGWRGFLALLKRYRRRRPINGVLVAISIQDVLTLDPGQRQQHVGAIKKRVAELQRYFGIRFPVYVLLTKCDLIPGFTEFFDDLGAEERAQVWGFTLSVEESRTLDNLDTHLKNEFAALLSRVQARVIPRLHDERDLTRRGALFPFPDQVAAVVEIVQGFLHDTFAPSVYELSAFLRGVYLTSGTQEGAPIDRLMGGLARSFGLESALATSTARQGRSYFITRLLRDVMFQESGLTGVNRRFERQRLWVQWAAYAGALLFTVLAIGAWTASHHLNRNYLSALASQVGAYHEVVKADITGAAGLSGALPRLEAAEAVFKAAAQYESGVPLAMRFGLYQGEYLAEAAHDAYGREVDNQLMPRLRAALERELADPQRDVYQIYELLRVYLMLGDPTHFKAEDIEAVAAVLTQREPAGTANAGTVLAHLKAGLAGEPRPQPISPEIVARARQRLAAQPLEVFVLNRIKRDFERGGEPPLRLLDLIGARGPSLVSRKSGQALDAPVSALYTRKGFYDSFLVQSALRVGTLAEEQWVLGDAGNGMQRMEIAALPANLSRLYEAEYIKTWDALIADVQFNRLGALQDASDKLLLLSGVDSPIRLLLTALERNTSLTELKAAPGSASIPGADKLAAVASAVTKAADRIGDVLAATGTTATRGPAPGQQIETHFKALREFVRTPDGAPARLDALLSSLGQIQQTISATGAGLGQDTASSVVVQGDVGRRLELEAQQLPPPVKQWILQLAGDVRSAVRAGAATEVKKQISAQVAASCAQLLKGRYPFEKGSPNDVKLADFARVFAQGGLIDAFFTAKLAPLVDTSSRPWRWKTAEGGGLGLSAAALQQFERAAAIRETFFGAGGAQPKISFDVKPVQLTPDLSQIMLSIDGQEVSYAHGPIMAKRLEWPSSGTGAVRIVFTRPDGTQRSDVVEGPWALFRFLGQTGDPASPSDRLISKFGFAQNTGAVFEFISGSALNPFRGALLSAFQCPGGM